MSVPPDVAQFLEELCEHAPHNEVPAIALRAALLLERHSKPRWWVGAPVVIDVDKASGGIWGTVHSFRKPADRGWQYEIKLKSHRLDLDLTLLAYTVVSDVDEARLTSQSEVMTRMATAPAQ